MLKLIKNDMFNIVSRIKRLDRNYFVFYNTKFSRYELYYKKGFKYNFELAFSNTCLTVLDYKKVCETLVTNIKNILKQIEKDNEKIQNKNDALLKDELIFKTKTLLRLGG